MRKLAPFALATALVLGACSESAQNTGTASGAGNGMGQGQPGISGMGANQTGIANLATAKQQLVSIGDRVFFDTDSSGLTGEDKATLDKQIAWLKANPSIRLVIEGHTDERGTREYNLALGERRAQTVKSYMMDNGIAAERLRLISYGKERPVAPGSDEASWAQNRRAVSVVDGL